MKMLRSIAPFACMAFLLAAAPLTQAQITGTVYENTPNPGDAGSSLNMASTLAQANFTVGAGGIDFQSGVGGPTVGGFLNNPTFTGAINGFNSTDLLNNSSNGHGTELVLTGSVYLDAGNNSFAVGHDDGVVLTIPGTGTGAFGDALYAPGPSGFTTTPFTFDNTKTAGLYSFTMDYSECCSLPADLLFTVNGAPPVGTTPEPSSFVLLGSGLLAAAGIVRRRLSV